MKDVHVWLPNHSQHGKVVMVNEYADILTVIMPGKLSAAFYASEHTPSSIAIPTKHLAIKQWAIPPDTTKYIAMDWDYSLSEGCAQPGAPSALEMAQTWEWARDSLCETRLCPNCKTGTYLLRCYTYNAWQCIICENMFSDQYLCETEHVATANIFGEKYLKPKPEFVYSEKAKSEFEGVDDLDPELWKGEGGLL